MNRELYFEFGRNITDKIREECNGIVRFRYYPEIDTIIFTITFKDFTFEYGVNYIEDAVCKDKANEIYEDFMREYKRTLLNAFFKSEERKRRESMYV